MLFLPLLALASLASATELTLNARDSSTATGDKTCLPEMCVGAVVNGSTVTYTLSSTGKLTPGWMAMGFGTQMTGSSVVIMWSNSDGSITLSQRKASGEFEPSLDNNPSRVATLSNALSTTSGNIQYVFTMAANSDTIQDIIFAFGTTNPGSSSPSATLFQHYNRTPATLDLTKALAADGTVPDPTIDAPINAPLLPYQRFIVAHGVLSVIGYLLFLPAGALIARYLRTFNPKWFMGHWIAQFAISGPVILTAFILGIMAVKKQGAPHLDDDHKKWGVAIFVLYVVQCSSGAIIHFVKPRGATRRPLQNYFHAILGLLIIGLALYQVRNGFKDEWVKMTGRAMPKSANVIWYVWVVLLPVLYFAGLALLPRQFRQEAGNTKEPHRD
ncbi:CBD9-like protein [Mycena floridula]|nr:CBD9-like protein [Mycena floridula]